MSKEMMNLARAVVANLPKGSVNPTDSEIMEALAVTLAKQESMRNQILGNKETQDAFVSILCQGLYEDFRK